MKGSHSAQYLARLKGLNESARDRAKLLGAYKFHNFYGTARTPAPLGRCWQSDLPRARTIAEERCDANLIPKRASIAVSNMPRAKHRGHIHYWKDRYAGLDRYRWARPTLQNPQPQEERTKTGKRKRQAATAAMLMKIIIAARTSDRIARGQPFPGRRTEEVDSEWRAVFEISSAVSPAIPPSHATGRDSWRPLNARAII